MLKIGNQTLGSGSTLGNIKLEGDNSWKTNDNVHTLTWELSGDIYTPKGTGFSSVNNSPIDSLMLEFITGVSPSTMVINDQKNAKGIFAAIRPANTEASLELDFGGKGLKVNKQLNVTFNNGTGKSATVKNLGALEGNVSIYDTTGNNTFTLTAKSIKGNIELSGGNSGSTAGVATSDSKITINGGSLVGNINTTSDINLRTANVNGTKGLSVTFENGASMQGNLGVYTGYDTIKKTLIFKGGDNQTVMTGNIISYSTVGDKDNTMDLFNANAGNHVTFENGDMTGNIIAAGTVLNQARWMGRGYNNITFGNGTSPSTHTLNGGILAELATLGGSGNAWSQVTNAITIKQGSTLHIKGTEQNTVKNDAHALKYNNKDFTNGSAKDYIIDQGSITAIGIGKNEITLQEGATLTLDGALITKVTASSTEQNPGNHNTYNTENILTFAGNNATFNGKIISMSKDTRINMNASNAKVNGTINSIQGTTTITVADSKNGSVTGDITKSGSGKNDITLTAATNSGNTALVLSGQNNQISTASLKNSSTLTLEGKNNTIDVLDGTSQTNTKLVLDAKYDDSTTKIVQLKGTGLEAEFKGTNKAQTLIIDGGNIQVKSVSVDTNSTNNTLDLSDIMQNNSNNGIFKITDEVKVESGEGLTIRLTNQDLTFSAGLNSSNSSNMGTTTIRVDATNSNANSSIAGTKANFSNLDLIAASDKTASLTLKTNDTVSINSITANAGEGIKKLIVDATGNALNADVTKITGSALDVELKGASNAASFSLGGDNSIVKSLSANNTNANNIDLKGSNNRIDTLNIGTNSNNSNTTNITFNGSSNTISLATPSVNTKAAAKATTASNMTTTIAKLTNNGDNNTLNLSGQAYNGGNTPARDHFQTLTIKELDASKSMNFIVYANPVANPNAGTTDGSNGGTGESTISTAAASTISTLADAGATHTPKADRIIIEGVGTASNGKATTHYLAITGNAADIIGKELYKEGDSNNIALATVKNQSNGGSNNPVVELKATNTISGFSLISFDMVSEKTDKNGKVTMTMNGDGGDGTNGYTTYFLGTAKSNGASYANQKASAAAMGTTYDLYLANMNSLNKRMGELRDNPKGQGVWARVFTGMQ